MSYKDGTPCKKCGTSAWYKTGACKECARQYAKRRNESHPEVYRNTRKKWKQNNKEKTREQSRIYRQRHPEKVKEYNREWYQNNKERNRENSLRWHRANPELNRQKARQWAASNKERNRERVKQWIKNNPDKKRQQKHKRRAIRAGNGGSFTPAEWRNLCARYGNRCLCCGRTDLPLTIDHVVPIVKGGTNDIGNIQPLCKPCNNKKYDRHIDYRPDKTDKTSCRWIQIKLIG